MRSFLGRFSKMGNLSKHFISKDVGGNKSVLIITDDSDNPLSDVAVVMQSASGKYIYSAITNVQGEAVLMGTIGKKYTLTLNKSGVQEQVVSDWMFVKNDTIVYTQIPS